MNRNFIQFAISVIMVLSAASFLSAETTLTLTKAVELALINHPQIAQLNADVETAKAQIGQAEADFWFPTADLSAGFTLLDYDSFTNSIIDGMQFISNRSLTVGPTTLTMPVLNQVKITNAFQDNYSIGISLAKPVFTGFKLQNSLKIKQLALEAAEKKLADKKNEVEANTKIYYLQILFLQESLGLQNDFSVHLNSRLSNTIDRFNAGSVSEYDKIRAEIQYENSLPAIDKLRSTLSNSRNSFFSTLGISSDDIILTGNLSNVLNFAMPADYETTYNLALSNDVNLRILNLQSQTMSLSKEIASGNRLPMVNAFFNYKIDYKKVSTFSDRSFIGSWNTGIQAAIGLDDFSPFSKTQKSMDEADSGIKRLEAVIEEYKEGLSVQLQALYSQLNDANLTLSRQSKTSIKAKLVYELAVERYDTGAAPLPEVTEAESTWIQTRVSVLQAYLDKAVSVIKLEKLSGI